MLVFVHVCMQSLQGMNVLTISYTCGENCTRPGLVGKMVLLSVRACVSLRCLPFAGVIAGRIGASDIQHIKRNSHGDYLRLLFHRRSH